MSTELDPIIGNWYHHVDKGQLFWVVALDEEAGVIELQHFDGDVEEIELPAWYEMTLEPAEAPEDWTGPVDEVGRDDLPYTETGMAPSDWRKSLEEVAAPAQEPWEDTGSADENDEWAEGTPAEEMKPQEEIEARVAQSAWSEAGSSGEEIPAEEEEAEPRE